MTDSVRPAATGPSRNGVSLRLAFLVSTTGDWIYRFAVPILILRSTGSALSTAFAYVLEFVPYIGLGLVAGVVADRWDRRRVMIFCDVTSMVVALVIAVLAGTDHPPIVALYAAAFGLACVRPFYFPAFQGLLVDVVPEQKLSRLNSWTQTVDSTLTLAGPVVGTAIIAAAGVPLATAVNAVSFGISALLVYRIAHRNQRGAEGAEVGVLTGVATDFVAGLRILWSTTAILWGTALMAAANLAAYVVEGSLVYLALRVEHLHNVALGVVFSAQGLGAVAGAVLAPRLLDRYPAGQMLTWGMGMSAVSMAIPVLHPQWWVVVLGWGTEGIATSLIIVSWFTARQKILPSEVMGRVVSISRAAAYATIPLGAVLGAWLVGIAGGNAVRVLFLAGALMQAAVFVGTAVSPVNRIERAATDPSPA